MIREYDGIRDGNNLFLMWQADYIRGEGGQLLAGETPVWQYNDQNGNGTTTAVYGGLRHYHLDQLGSVRLVTDAGKRTLGEHDYYPYGVTPTKAYQEELNPGTPHIDPMRYAGHQRDFLGYLNVENTDYLDYMHARYYDPKLGRFLSVDPVLDVKNAIKRPQMWNRYAYVLNNPLRFTDPTGRYVCRGTARECAVIDAAIAGMKTAAAGLEEGSDQRVKLEKAIAFFGNKGQTNGVYVRTDLTQLVAAATRTDGLITMVRVNLDYMMFQSSTGKNGSVYATEMSAIMGHEAGHGVIHRLFGMSRTGGQNRMSETEAFYTQAAVNEGMGHNSNKGIWTRANGLDENAIQRWVEIANREFCSQQGVSCQ